MSRRKLDRILLDGEQVLTSDAALFNYDDSEEDTTTESR